MVEKHADVMARIMLPMAFKQSSLGSSGGAKAIINTIGLFLLHNI